MHYRGISMAFALVLALIFCLTPAPSLAESMLKGRLGLQWHTLTRTNSASADYQTLRGYARLSSEAMGPLQMRLHLDARGKKGFDEHLQESDRAFRNRAQVQQVYFEAPGPMQTRLFAGRHRTPLRNIGSQAIDGLSIQREMPEWSARISGGSQVAFWRPNTPVDTATYQWGGELEWHPTGLPVRLQTAALSDRDTEGRSRSRIGLGGSWRASA